MREAFTKIDRREFFRSAAAGLAAAGTVNFIARPALAEESAAPVKVDPKAVIHRNESPDFVYRRLGRTNFNCGRIVAGWIREPAILRRLIAQGVNYIDTARGYGEYEVELADLLKRVRDKVWLTSKSTGIAGHDTVDDEVQKLYRKAMAAFLGDRVTIEAGNARREINPADAARDEFLALHKECMKKMKATGESPDWRPVGHRIADMYARKLDESLQRMKVDNVDCYMMHGIEIPWIWQCTELWDTYEKAKKAGKVNHFGFSTHKHQKEVLASAVEANKTGPWKIDLVMPGVHPTSFHEYRPELEALKKQDVGIIAMKSSGTIRAAVTGPEKKLADLARNENLNSYERAKAYMLHATDDLVDAVIAQFTEMAQIGRAMTLAKFKLSAAARRKLESEVRQAGVGACHLCGRCSGACPRGVAVSDLVRAYAYAHQYGDRDMAASVVASLGYDPRSRCTRCGTCTGVCPAGIDLPRTVHETASMLA